LISQRVDNLDIVGTDAKRLGGDLTEGLIRRPNG
jgi:hypothetical protein